MQSLSAQLGTLAGSQQTGMEKTAGLPFAIPWLLGGAKALGGLALRTAGSAALGGLAGGATEAGFQAMAGEPEWDWNAIRNNAIAGGLVPGGLGMFKRTTPSWGTSLMMGGGVATAPRAIMNTAGAATVARDAARTARGETIDTGPVRTLGEYWKNPGLITNDIGAAAARHSSPSWFKNLPPWALYAGAGLPAAGLLAYMLSNNDDDEE